MVMSKTDIKGALASSMSGIDDSRQNYSITPDQVRGFLNNIIDSLLAQPPANPTSTSAVLHFTNGNTNTWGFIAPVDLNEGNTVTIQGNRAKVLTTTDGTTFTFTELNTDAHLPVDAVGRLLPVNPTDLDYVHYDGDSNSWTLGKLPAASTDQQGIVELADGVEASDANNRSVAITPQTMFEGLTGFILPDKPDNAGLAGRLIRVDSSGTGIEIGPDLTGPQGPKGDDGDRGNPGASAYVLYQTNNSINVPTAPTQDTPAGTWTATYTAPSSGAAYAWMAFRVGTGSWAIILVAQHQTSGGSTTPTTQDHAIYMYIWLDFETNHLRRLRLHGCHARRPQHCGYYGQYPYTRKLWQQV